MTDTPLFDDNNEPTTPFDRGMAASEASADANWTEEMKEQVRSAIRVCARDLDRFTTDDVWERVPPWPNGIVRKGIGSYLRSAKKQGLTYNSGDMAISRRAENNNGQRLTVWASVQRCGPEPQPQPSPEAELLGNIREDLEIVRKMLADDRADTAIFLIDEMLRGYF